MSTRKRLSDGGVYLVTSLQRNMMADREDAAQAPDSATVLSESDSERGLSHGASAALAALVLCVVLWGVYGRTLHQPFIFDDRGSILDNSSIKRLRPLLGDARGDGPLNSRNETIGRRPLANLSLAINYRLGGLHPEGYHLFSIVVHFLTALLLWMIVGRTLRLPFFGDKFADVADPLALLVTLVWALHPLQTESVAYVTQRTELMVGFCYLSTFYSSLRYWDAKSRGERFTWLALATLSCLVGVGCKEVIVTAPALVLLFERTFIAGSFRRAIRESWPLYLGLALSWGWLLALSVYGPRYGTAGFGRGVPVLAYWATQAKVLLMYLKLTLFPWPLVIHYDFPLLDTIPSALLAVVPVAALVIVTLVLIWRRTAAGFLGACLFVILSPTLVVPMSDEIAAERRMYLPLAAIAALLVVGGYSVAQKFTRKLPTETSPDPPGATPLTMTGGCALLIAAILFLLSANRVRYYDDPVKLWEDAVAHQAHDWLTQANYGDVLNKAGRPQDAVPHFQEALRLKPGRAPLHHNLAIALSGAGRLPEAIEQFEETVRIEPSSASYYHDLGAALLNAGQLEPAIERFETSLKLNPNSIVTQEYLATALLNADRPQEAIERFEQVLRIDPDSPGAQRKLAFALAKAGQPQAAIKQYEQSMNLVPDSAADRFYLGHLFSNVDLPQEAIIEFNHALRLAPDSATVHYELGQILAGTGKEQEAIEHFESAQRLNPNDLDLYIRLASAYASAGNIPAAILKIEKGIVLARAQGQPAQVEKLEAMLKDYHNRPAAP
ncbi:MAG TPA: tetratricopeptide repeat protein [Pirellulales bacterium]